MKKMYQASRKWLLVIAVLSISLAYRPDYFEISKQLDIFTNVFKEVSLYYVDDTEPGQLNEEALNAMLATLDPYTTYIPEERVEDFKIKQTGNYGGIGASVGFIKGEALVTGIFEGFGADLAGIKVGDVILEVDGERAEGRNEEALSDILKGSPGSETEIVLMRGDEQMKLTVKRAEVHMKAVPFAGIVKDGFGYISLNSFTQNASGEVLKAWQKLKSVGPLKGLILDLRNNPGGLLSEAIGLTNLFIPQGKPVVLTKGKLEEWQKTYKTPNQAFDKDLPVAVLINSGSASASEIVAGTLQDYDRAIVVGRRSFGKGLVQESRMLPYGAQLKVTIAKYYTPSGRLIQAIDYAERAKDGSVTKIPDSLRTKFLTENGRTVFDGGGIDPDIETASEEASDFLIALFQQLHLFDFATEYYRKNAEIADPMSFRVTEADFKDFKTWLSKRDFNFDSRTGRVIKRLIAATEADGYDKALETDIAKLKESYERQKAKELEANKVLVMELLQEEIVARYYYDSGRLANALSHDKDIATALEFLGNDAKYQAVLKP
jgi:carboxyl-terminal processing protease